MNEINIYKKIKYRKVIKSANMHFNKKKKFLFKKTVIANKTDTYSISINKNSIRICYWDENSKTGLLSQNTIKSFLLENFEGETLFVFKEGNCNILNNLDNIKIVPALRRCK